MRRECGRECVRKAKTRMREKQGRECVRGRKRECEEQTRNRVASGREGGDEHVPRALGTSPRKYLAKSSFMLSNELR